MNANPYKQAFRTRIKNHHTKYAPAIRLTADGNNADKARDIYNGRKLLLDAAEVLQLRYEEKLGPAIIACRPRHRWAGGSHVIGTQIASAATGNSRIVLAIAEPVGGNYGFGGFLTATELDAL